MLGLNFLEVAMKKICLFLTAIFTFPTLGHAQMTWYPPAGAWPGAIQSTNNVINDSLSQVDTNKSDRYSTRPDDPFLATTSLTYTPSVSRTRANLQELGRKLIASDPINGAKAADQLASSNIIGAVGDHMEKRLGLERYNVAHAYTMYWITYWGLVNKNYTSVSAIATRAVAKQAERAFASNAEFTKTDNATRQQAAEELLALAGLFDASQDAAKNDPVLAEKFAKAALEGSRKSQLELDKMTLTEQGFVKATGKKRSDASDAVPGGQQSGADGTQMASASATKGDTDEGTGSGLLPGVLIAGLAGSTLAAAFLYGKNKGAKKGNG
jgi:hypothetical protein